MTTNQTIKELQTIGHRLLQKEMEACQKSLSVSPNSELFENYQGQILAYGEAWDEINGLLLAITRAQDNEAQYATS